MHYPDVPFIPGQSYSFQYPNFEDSTDYRRMTFECLASRHGAVCVVGMDLNTGHEARWLPELMIDVQPYEPVLIPQRFATCRHKGKEIELFVFSVYPQVDGDDFKVTGKVNGRFFAAWLSEIEVLPEGSETSYGLAPNQVRRSE